MSGLEGFDLKAGFPKCIGVTSEPVPEWDPASLKSMKKAFGEAERSVLEDNLGRMYTEVIPAYIAEMSCLRKMLGKHWVGGFIKKLSHGKSFGEDVTTTVYISLREMDEGGYFFIGDRVVVCRNGDRIINAVFYKDSEHTTYGPFRQIDTKEYYDVCEEVEKLVGNSPLEHGDAYYNDDNIRDKTRDR